MTENVIDSRTLINRYEELDAQYKALTEALDEASDDPNSDEYMEAVKDFGDWCLNGNEEEYQTLADLMKEGEDYFPDWSYGITLVRNNYFKEYTMEFAEDIGVINKDICWPYTCIDWEKAAEELKMDYTAIEIDGVTYWGR